LTTVDLHNGNYTPDLQHAALEENQGQVRAIPGAGSAALSRVAPHCGCLSLVEVSAEGYAPKSHEDVLSFMSRVSDGYLKTLGVRLVTGRDFDRHDGLTSPKVALVNETFAKKYYGGASPVGRTLRTQRDGKALDAAEIVGVVKDSTYGSLRERVPPAIYFAWSQYPVPDSQVTLELRSAAGAPSALIRGVKEAIAQVNPGVSLQFTTLSSKLDESISRERLLAALSGLFGAIALLLATIGLYGVMSYSVARRRNEIGIRMALGAAQGRVLRMVLRETALMIGIGIIVGLAAATATTRFVASFLYGLRPNDPLTLFLAAAVLGSIAMLAGYLPARRASKQNPMTALREE
jgi:putative ABC transport system permease protein